MIMTPEVPRSAVVFACVLAIALSWGAVQGVIWVVRLVAPAARALVCGQ